MLHALGAPPSLAVVVLAYFVGQIANTIPIPGAVSGGMVGVLIAFGVETDLALASVLAYRGWRSGCPLRSDSRRSAGCGGPSPAGARRSPSRRRERACVTTSRVR